ncbi:MAG: hypothetical protein Q8877_03315 [Sweet potato little leaf phytoplasma]|nr:hypothetical protein [Sweet potato little leaf phytoplasma]
MRRTNKFSLLPTDFLTAFATERFFNFIPMDFPTALRRTTFPTDRSVGKINLKKYPSIIPTDWSVGKHCLK